MSRVITGEEGVKTLAFGAGIVGGVATGEWRTGTMGIGCGEVKVLSMRDLVYREAPGEGGVGCGG